MRWPTKVKKIYDPIIEQGMAAAWTALLSNSRETIHTLTSLDVTIISRKNFANNGRKAKLSTSLTEEITYFLKEGRCHLNQNTEMFKAYLKTRQFWRKKLSSLHNTRTELNGVVFQTAILLIHSLLYNFSNSF